MLTELVRDLKILFLMSHIIYSATDHLECIVISNFSED